MPKDAQNLNKMPGMTWTSLKRHSSLIPLFAAVGAGAVGCILYSIRLATRNPDVSWFRSSNPLPNQEFADKQYKFYSPNVDHNKLKSPAPKYED